VTAGAPRRFRAPGRVNLIGEHTDYNEGFVLPLAIDLECVITATARDDQEINVRWLDGDRGSDRYATAVAEVLAERGRAAIGIDAELSSTVPVGSGLSSSAALEVAVALALNDAAGFALSDAELARACQEAELRATGVPCGVMDQLVSIAGRRDCAVLIDCRTLETTAVPLPASLAIIVVHSGMPRTLAGSAYAERRAACEAAAQRLGLRALRDATVDQVADDPRARHVVSENARVLSAVEALRESDFAKLGGLLLESHRSLRDDFEVSTPELDALVDCLVSHGALGARLTGAGFGGCVVALGEATSATELTERACDAYARATGLTPTPHICRASEGAGAIDERVWAA
jgi:galactokinase